MNDAILSLSSAYRFPEERPAIEPSSHGWLHEHNMEALSLGLGEETSVAIELGSWHGLTTRFMADRAPNAAIIAIDHWKGSPEMATMPDCLVHIPTLYETFLSSCWDYRHRIIPLKMETIEGMRLIHSRGIKPALVYVDAGHGTEAVREDVLTVRRLFPDAELVGDDIQWPSVRAALTGLLKDKILDAVDYRTNCWWRPTPRLAALPKAGRL